MKTTLKRLVLGAISAGPIYGALRARALKDNPVTILCYHTLRPDADPLDAWTALGVGAFRAQIAMLRETYEIVSLDDALASDGGARPRAVLTFDDGERGLHDHLLPIVKAEALPVTIYVATGQIETGTPYWFDHVMNALQSMGETSIDMTNQGLGKWVIGPDRGKARWAQIGMVLEALKAAPPADRERLSTEIVAQAGPRSDGFMPLHPMTLPQLRELAAHPQVTIGAHSHGHELLDQLPLDAARASIAHSRDLLEGWTGQPVRHFAYPNGNYTPALMGTLNDLGFASATILEDRLVRADAPAQSIPRIGVGRYDSLARLKLRIVEV